MVSAELAIVLVCWYAVCLTMCETTSLTILNHIGWQLANTWYHAQIESLLNRMHALMVLEENSEFVNRYLNSSGIFLATIISRSNREVTTPGTVEIIGLVRKWMDTVEEKLETTLKDLRYEVDAPETLALLFGNERIERVSNHN